MYGNIAKEMDVNMSSIFSLTLAFFKMHCRKCTVESDLYFTRVILSWKSIVHVRDISQNRVTIFGLACMTGSHSHSDRLLSLFKAKRSSWNLNVLRIFYFYEIRVKLCYVYLPSLPSKWHNKVRYILLYDTTLKHGAQSKALQAQIRFVFRRQ